MEYLQDPADPGAFIEKRIPAAPLSPSSKQFTFRDLAGPPLVATGHFTATSPADSGGWWRQIGAPSLYENAGSEYARLAIADIDGDGRGDVVLLSRKSIDVYLQTAPNTYTHDANYLIPTTAAASVYPFGIVIADIDHDGLPDVTVSTGELFYFPQDPAARGKFGPAAKIGP